MAADWIKWLKGLSRKREVLAVAHKLGMDRRIVACACMEFWEWADDETSDGHIQGVTPADIDAQVSIPGFADALAVLEVGWLRVSARGISIPNFVRHNGKSAKRRALDSVRKSQDASAKFPHAKRKKSGPEKRREEKRVGGKPPTTPDTSSSANGDGPTGFAMFWKLWPKRDRKVDKAKCLALWKRKKLDPQTDGVLSGLRRWITSVSWAEGFDPQPARWLREERWLVDPEQADAVEGIACGPVSEARAREILGLPVEEQAA